MTRITLLDESDPLLSEDARSSLAEARQARGRLLNIHRALANRPEVARAFGSLVHAAYRGGSTLAPKHGELAYLTATAVNNCHY